MDLALSTNNLISTVSEKVSELQENFLSGVMGSALNSAVDSALRAVLPDTIEEDVIDAKDSLLEKVSDTVEQIVDKTKEYAKDVLGIITENFETVSQVISTVKSDGIVTAISNLVDNLADKQLILV